MKRGTIAGLAALLFAGATAANAQYVFAGGGATIPIGDFKDYAKTGWNAQAGFGFDIASVRGLSVEAEGFYGSNKHSDVDGDKTNIIAGMGSVLYSFMPDKKVSPYALAGAGFLSHKFDPATGDSETSTKFGYTGAVGLIFSLSSKASLWVEGRLLGSKDSKMLPINAGFSINFGKSSM
jgi:opacity protein-like surface antigen